jgi:hypothetical protein
MFIFGLTVVLYFKRFNVVFHNVLNLGPKNCTLINKFSTNFEFIFVQDSTLYACSYMTNIKTHPSKDDTVLK